MKSFPECEKNTYDPKILLKEKRAKSNITFDNPDRKKILIIKVDGCVINNSEHKKCDYAIVPCDGFDQIENYFEIYIELKGRDIERAIKQLESTILLLSDNPKTVKKQCFIVSTRVPKQTTSIQLLQSQFKKKFNAGLQVKNTPATYDLSKLLD
jgi:hypothetical protein